MDTMISIAIIEDQFDIRQSLKEFISLQQDMLCEICAESVEEFLEINESMFNPDILLLDIDLPGLSGINGIQFIKQKFPKIEIMMLTVYKDGHKIFDSLKAGAAGYLLKTTSLPRIKEAIYELYAGGSPMSPIIARKVIEHFNKPQTKNPEENLTQKEKQIVSYLVDGQSYKKIADTLGNSIDTIRTHIRNIYRKLEVTSKAELIIKHIRK